MQSDTPTLTRPSPAALREQVARAFGPRAYPGDGALGINTPNCEWYEGEVVARFFKGRDWQGLTFADLFDAPDSPLGSIPAFMTADAFAYYLPAFLLMALDVDPADHSDRQNHLYTFASSVCFFLAAPSPTSLAEQYELVKDMPDVPDDIKQSLRCPTPEAKAAERARIEYHDALVAMLSADERAAVAAVLDHLAPVFDEDGVAPEFNDARRALDTSWGAFRA